jgi:hypothetical protein
MSTPRPHLSRQRLDGGRLQPQRCVTRWRWSASRSVPVRRLPARGAAVGGALGRKLGAAGYTGSPGCWLAREDVKGGERVVWGGLAAGFELVSGVAHGDPLELLLSLGMGSCVSG